MIATRVRNPEKKLINSVKQFAQAPKESAERMFRIGKQEGYDFIQAAAQGLLEMSKDADDARAFKYAAMLTQPEWKFYTIADPNALAVVIECEGEFKVVGFYGTGGSENGSVTLSMDYTGVNLLEPSTDPRDAFVSTRIKQKVFRQSRKYYVVECAKKREDLEYFYPEDRIQATRRPGYLWRYEAYVVTAGPFKTAAEAKDNRVQILGDK